MNNSEGQTQEPVGGIVAIRNWIRTNGEMSEDGKTITYNCEDLENIISQQLAAPIKTEGERLPVKDVFASDKDIINAGYITDELLPCPFCGNKTVLTYGNKNEKTGNITYFVTCNRMSGCGANIFTCLGGEETADKARQEMVDTWNNRKVAPPSPVGIDVAQLFDNNFDCYTCRFENDGSMNDNIPAMSKEKFIELFKAGYSASLPQSSTEEEKDLWMELITEVERNKFLSTKYVEVIKILQSKFKISKR